MDERPARILFLDDMDSRHKAFRDAAWRQGMIIDYVFTAAEAIHHLVYVGNYDQAFLDHDLSDDDIMSAVGEKTKVPTGIAVVDFMVANPALAPSEVFIHSHNEPAASEMAKRLRPVTKVRVTPFAWLISLIKASGADDSRPTLEVRDEGDELPTIGG